MLKKLDWSCLTGLITLIQNWIGLFLRKKISFKMLGLNFSSNLDWGWYIISIAKTASENIGAFNCSVKFFPLRLLLISVNLPYGHTWNTVVLSGMVLLDTTWNC